MRKIIATVGPSLLYRVPLTSIHHPDNIYRINGAHGSIDEIGGHVHEIRKQVKGAEILIDLPGNKVRTANLKQPVELQKEKPFSLQNDQTNYPGFYSHLKPGDTVWANDSTFKFTVMSSAKNSIEFMSHSEGSLLSNKGLHVRGIHESISFLFDKDNALIELVNEEAIDYIGLSFVRNTEDILSAKKLLNDTTCVISKVETLSAVENLNAILTEVDYILIDRGDLSTEVGIEKIPSYQRHILEKTAVYNKKAFVATQVLKNMEEKPIPTIAEINDLYTLFKLGIFGIQLSEETAVGLYPKECLETVRRLYKEVSSENIRKTDCR
jgi:pyruvate kinase